MDPDTIRIHYHRPPDRKQLFVQRHVHTTSDAVVTFLESFDTDRVMRIEGETVLEPGSPIVWFTFPGRWHDIGRFHDAAGRFTGIYANILTPVERVEPGVWHTTDLFLDIFLGPTGVRLLDEPDLEEAVRRGWVTAAAAAKARREADRLLSDARSGDWPPPVVDEWTLDRVRAKLGAGT